MALKLEPPRPSRAVLLQNVTWREFLELVAEFEGSPGIRIAYDRGRLELISPGKEHERVKALLGRLVEALGDELGIEVDGCGSTTWKREDADCGVEADNCYYIRNAEVACRSRDADLSVDPPPDLGIEIDITRKSLPRNPIYGALGVRELWRYDDSGLTFHERNESGGYDEVERSPAFPFLSAGEIERFLALRDTVGATEISRRFREWVRGLGA